MKTSQTIDNLRYNVQCKVRETITVQGTAKTLTAGNVTHTTYGKARYAEVTVTNASVRFTRDGSVTPAPATHIGMILSTTQVLPLYWNDIANFTCIIEITGATAYLQVDYFYDV